MAAKPLSMVWKLFSLQGARQAALQLLLNAVVRLVMQSCGMHRLLPVMPQLRMLPQRAIDRPTLTLLCECLAWCCCQAGPEGPDSEGLNSDLVGALAQQLEEAQAQLAVVAPQAAAAEVHVKQQQQHLQQLAGEVQAAKAAQKAAEEKTEVLQVRRQQDPELGNSVQQCMPTCMRLSCFCKRACLHACQYVCRQQKTSQACHYAQLPLIC
jgi:hypothetical protein